MSVRVTPWTVAVELQVADDGRGMDASRPREALAAGHIGLASVVQRVEANGGELKLEAAAGRGHATSGSACRADQAASSLRATAPAAGGSAGGSTRAAARSGRRLVARWLGRRELDHGRFGRGRMHWSSSGGGRRR